LVEVIEIIQFTIEILHFTNKTSHWYFRHWFCRHYFYRQDHIWLLFIEKLIISDFYFVDNIITNWSRNEKKHTK
jgi:hypothetical protein